MTFAIPWAFWALLALPLAAAIFLYRRRIPVVVVPALAAWMTLGEPVNAWNWRNLLRRLLALLLQLLILALLIFGAAEPLWHAKGAESAVLVIDASATLRTRTNAGATRFNAARDKARQLLASLPADCQVRLIIASDVPRALAGPTPTQTPDQARQALDDLQPDEVDSDLPEAVRLATSFLPAGQRCQIAVISDFAAAEPQMIRQAYKGQAPLTLLSVGDNLPNAAIVHAYVEPATPPILHGTLGQRGLDGQTIPVELWCAGRQLGTQNVTLSASSAEVSIPLPASTNSRIVELRLAIQDGLDLDNRFVMRTDGISRQITLITDGNRPLEAILRSADNAAVRVLSPEAFATRPAASGQSGVMVFDRVRPASVQSTPGGSYLFIAAADPFGWTAPAGNQVLPAPTSWATGHPVLAELNVSAFPPMPAIALQPQPGTELTSLIDAGDAPLLVEAHRHVADPTRATGRALYFLADPFRGSLSNSLAFPVLILNAIDYLADTQDLHAPYLRTGQTLSVQGPAGLLKLPRFDHTGEQEVTLTPTTRDTVAVNYISTRSLQPLPAPEAAPATPTTASFLSRLTSPLRLSPATFLLAGLALAIIEFTLFHRGHLHID